MKSAGIRSYCLVRCACYGMHASWFHFVLVLAGAEVRREALAIEVLRRSANQTSNLPKVGSAFHQARLSVPGLKAWFIPRSAIFQVRLRRPRVPCMRLTSEACQQYSKFICSCILQPATIVPMLNVFVTYSTSIDASGSLFRLASR